MDSSLGSSVLFFRHVAIFFIAPCYYFLSKTDVWFYIHYIFKNIQRILINNFNKTDREKMNE